MNVMFKNITGNSNYILSHNIFIVSSQCNKTRLLNTFINFLDNLMLEYYEVSGSILESVV